MTILNLSELTVVNLSRIDENYIRNNINDIPRCNVECQLRYNFQEQSSSFMVNKSPMGFIITNEFLSNINNNGVMAVRFGKQDYWLHHILITGPGLLFNSNFYTNEDNDILYSDPSACEMMIVCYNNREALRITRLIRTNINSSDVGSSELSQLINNIRGREATVDGDSLNFLIPTLNINNFISRNTNYFYIPSEINFHRAASPLARKIMIANGNSMPLHDIIYPSDQAMTINNNTLNNMPSGLPNFSISHLLSLLADNPLPTTRIPSAESRTRLIKLYISSESPINNLSLDDGDNIFIRCQPTDNDGNILVSGQSVAPDQNNMNIDIDIDEIFGENKNVFTGAIIGIILMIAIMGISEYLMKNGSNFILPKK